jgi:hypothetical protein
VYQASGGGRALSRLKLNSTSDLIQLPANVVNQLVDDGLPQWHAYGTQLLNQGAALYDQISAKFDDVMTMIDRDKFTGDENDLFMYQQPNQTSPLPPADATHHSAVSKSGQGKKSKKDVTKAQIGAVATSPLIGGYFAKVDLYANSRLPSNLPSFHV